MGNTVACPTCGLSNTDIDRSSKHFGCPGQITDLERANIEAVRKHALEHYSDGGWDTIVECYEDKDILEVVKRAVSGAEAVKMMAELAGIHEERYREAVGPDVKCLKCGQTYPYEVGHFCRYEMQL
jgi:hypothetical protein